MTQRDFSVVSAEQQLGTVYDFTFSEDDLVVTAEVEYLTNEDRQYTPSADPIQIYFYGAKNCDGPVFFDVDTCDKVVDAIRKYVNNWNWDNYVVL